MTKLFTLTLFVTLNIAYLNAQVVQNSTMSFEEGMLPNVQVLPSAINYKEFQKNIIELNKITNLEVYKYDVKNNGQADSTLLWASNFIYDNKNRIIEQQEFDSRQKLVATDNYYYNELNMLIKKTVNKKHGSSSEINNVSFSFDSIGRIEYASYYNRDTSFLTTIKNIYNDSSRIVKHLIKVEAANKLLTTQTQTLAYEAYTKIFKVNQFQIADTVLYNPENKVVSIQNYDIVHKISFSYLIDYNGADPMEINVTKQTQQKKYVIGKILRNRFNQILLRSETPEDTEVADYNPKKDMREKFIYNADCTLNTSICYNGTKLKYIYKFFYKK